MTAQRVIVLGALSAIGEATTRLYAAEGARLALVGRRQDRLDRLAADLKARGAHSCCTYAIDLAEPGDTQGLLARMAADLGGKVDLILLFYGMLGDHRRAEHDPAEARSILRVNFTSAAEWCLAAAELLERQGGGTLVVSSSVAGDRGRQSNYLYGAAKGGLAILMQGLAHRLSRVGAKAIVVKLGFVDTPMTRHIANRGLLWAKPEAVGRQIKNAINRRHPTVYVPKFWRPIMLTIRLLPAAIMHRTNL